MEIIAATKEHCAQLAPLVAAFRVALRSYKGISSQPDVAAGAQELSEYLEAGFPVYAALDGEKFAGYLVCRVEPPCVWVESIYVDVSCRRKGVATLLHKRAEELARSYGEDMLYHYVHPNNQGMIAFLRRRGYSVLNLIEIRKPWQGEQPSQKIRVGENIFDY